ncbi:hypothetical protein [Niabella hirudinis]|uniref:hypothetical protein n=1 Tax=Niabella hirudinis TaxID=1285929 RepID=UPI003EBFA5DE
MAKSLTYLVLFFICCIAVSCNRYIDVAKTRTRVPIMQDYFDFYPDSNVFLHKTNVVLTKDTEKIYPKSFKVKLPKGLRWYGILGSSDFEFHYDKKQVVFINIDLDIKEANRDTAYSPSQDELNNFVLYKISTSDHKKDNIKAIPININRKQMFIKKGAATILLYNIDPKRYQLFYNYVNGFSFIGK